MPLCCLCSQVNVFRCRISSHLKYSNNTCSGAQRAFFPLLYFSHHQWKQLSVLQNITVWLRGRVQTRDIVRLLSWSMLCGTLHRHIISWTRKGNDRPTSAGKSLMQRNILCNARNTIDISPLWTEIAAGARRLDTSPCVQGIDSNCTVNRATYNTGHECIQCACLRNDPQSQWIY